MASTIATLSAAELPPSPVAGSIASHADQGALYAVNLIKGESFEARIPGVTGAPAVGLLLYAPGTTSVEEHEKVLAGYKTNRYPSPLVNEIGGTFVAPQSGTYFLRVLNMGGAGGYTIEWAKRPAPPPIDVATSIKVATTSAAYGKTTRVFGTVLAADGKLVAGEHVELWSAPYPGTDLRTKVAETTTGSQGTYSFAVSPTKPTSYRVVTLGMVSGYAPAMTSIRAPYFVGAPRVSDKRKYRNKAFYTWGYMRPKHNVGAKTVWVRCYHKEKQQDGTYKYVWRKTVYATNYAYSANYTQYKKKLTLPYKGWWRMYAYAAEDKAHAASTSSSAKYVYVR